MLSHIKKNIDISMNQFIAASLFAFVNRRIRLQSNSWNTNTFSLLRKSNPAKGQWKIFKSKFFLVYCQVPAVNVLLAGPTIGVGGLAREMSALDLGMPSHFWNTASQTERFAPCAIQARVLTRINQWQNCAETYYNFKKIK
jgi:hypothetical protein